MDVNGILAELRAELERLNMAISALELLSYGGHRRRGRPPKWMTETRRRHVMPPGGQERLAAQRKKMAEYQRQHRAKVKAEKAAEMAAAVQG